MTKINLLKELKVILDNFVRRWTLSLSKHTSIRLW